MGKELELKLELDGIELKEAVDQITHTLQKQGVVLQWQEKHLTNAYFDTPDFALNKKRMALRIRKLGDRLIQTLKTKGSSVNGLSERGEWEWELEQDVLNQEVLKALDVWPENIEPAELETVFTTNFTRLAGEFTWHGGVVELALDFGEVRSQGKSLPINEIELELKAGGVEVIKRLGAVISEQMSAKPSDISKAERGYQLYLL